MNNVLTAQTAHRVVAGRQGKPVQIHLEYADRGTAGPGAQLSDHRRARLDPVDRHPSLDQRYRQPAGAESELEDPAIAGRGSQSGDGLVRGEPGSVDLVVDGRVSLAVLRG